MPSSTDTTKPVWFINEQDKKDWLKKHRSDTQLKKKFDKFEKSVVADPINNRDVKKLKPPLDDVYEYKKPPVRGLYSINHSDAEISLVDFDWKGNIKYK